MAEKLGVLLVDVPKPKYSEYTYVARPICRTSRGELDAPNIRRRFSIFKKWL